MQRLLAFPTLKPKHCLSQPSLTQVLACQSVYFVVCGNEPLLICFLPTNLYYVLLSIIFPVSMMLPTSKPVPVFLTLQVQHHWEIWSLTINAMAIALRFAYHSQSKHVVLQSLSSFHSPQSLFVLLYPFVMLCLSLCCKLLQASMSSVCSAKCFFRQ